MICEYASSAASGKVYIYGHTLISQGNSWYYLYNAHGDVVKYINTTGAVLQSYDYDAFGEEADPSATDTNPFRYAGQYFDDETGTYYLRARYYNPGNGRFTQQDSWGYADPADPLSLNLYVYCINNPVMYIDPSGNSLQDIIAGIGFALDDALTDGTVKWVMNLLLGGNRNYIYESEYDYYLGRVIGGVLGMVMGIVESASGILKIIEAIVGGAAVTFGTGGGGAVIGVGVAKIGIVAGAVELVYGYTVITMSLSNFADDLSYLHQIKNNPRYKEGRPAGGNPREDELVRKDRAKIKSDDFKDFLRANGENPSKWEKVMETWKTPEGIEYERHYWTNGKKSYYHD